MSDSVRAYLTGKVVEAARKVRHVVPDVRGDGLLAAVRELDQAVDALEEFEAKMAEIESQFATERPDNGCRCGNCNSPWCVEHLGPPYGDPRPPS